MQKAETDKQLSVEKEAHQATQQEKEESAAALTKLQAQMALESQAHQSVSETAKLVSNQINASSNVAIGAALFVIIIIIIILLLRSTSMKCFTSRI